VFAHGGKAVHRHISGSIENISVALHIEITAFSNVFTARCVRTELHAEEFNAIHPQLKFTMDQQIPNRKMTWI
jgi:hypothetical protein